MQFRFRDLLFVSTTMILAPATMLAACGDDADVNPTSAASSTAASSGSGAGGPGICLLNNCSEDAHCAGCEEGRNKCLVAENRCVACDANQPIGQQGCPPGQECSSFGLCVPEGTTCPTDNDGNPQITCTKNSDCSACSPAHQVCDTATGKCQACTATNTQHCLQSDICVDGQCSPKCPQSCTVDNDCSQCGGPGNEAHACFNHKCAQCSDTYPCPAGNECINGVCIPPCGLPGPVAGTCTQDEDCKFCGEKPAGDSDWTCNLPVNDDHGKCVPAAAGCEDLVGGGLAVLPEPYDQYTQLCSNDANCNGVSIEFHVGKFIAEQVGDDELDLGFATVDINDDDVCDPNSTNDPCVEYEMPICAAITLPGDNQCGICVPCQEDTDCVPIPVDPLVQQIFKGDALAQIAAALLFDLLWGDNPDHNINFWCQPVAAGYGACIPCGNPLQPCGDNSGGGMGSGMCDHPETQTGGPLDPSCNACTAAVCQADNYCCTTEWDDICVGLVASECGTASPCDVQPGPLDSGQGDACVDAICAADSYCCDTQWDDVCVSAAEADTTNCSCP